MTNQTPSSPASSAHGPFGSQSIAEAYRTHLEPVIFEPWAQRLCDFVQVAPGERVLDVAAGTGAVARVAARRVGPGGSVTAADLSPAMLSQVVRFATPEDAPIETVECPADNLLLQDSSVDLVLCQQALQFLPDAGAAVREMRRVLKSPGRIGVSVWMHGPRLEPFTSYIEVLTALGVPEPFPRAYDPGRLQMTGDELELLLEGNGFHLPHVTIMELTTKWASPEATAHGIMGTPFATAVAALAAEEREAVFAKLAETLSGPRDAAHDDMVALFAVAKVS